MLEDTNYLRFCRSRRCESFGPSEERTNLPKNIIEATAKILKSLMRFNENSIQLSQMMAKSWLSPKLLNFERKQQTKPWNLWWIFTIQLINSSVGRFFFKSKLIRCVHKTTQRPNHDKSNIWMPLETWMES